MIYLVLGIVVLGFLAIRKARPASNKSGIGFKPVPEFSVSVKQNTQASLDESQQQQGLLKVATYNIQTGKSLSGQRDIHASARVVSSAHLVGIQEVYAPSWLNIFGIGTSQSEQLAAHGGFSWLFSATRLRWLREHRGNTLLSKLAISDWQIKMLPDQSRKSYRNLTIAKAQWGSKTFHVLNTHLHTRKGRDQQIDTVLREFAQYSPAILMGDFNCTSKELTAALSDVDISDAIAIAQLDPQENQRIDWILTKGFSVEGGKFQEKGVSDHPYYQVNLR